MMETTLSKLDNPKKVSEIAILRNSLFLMTYPLLLNLLSVLVIGYIARKLGPSDFGIFNFVIIFVMTFLPLGRMGLDNVAVRDLAALRADNNAARRYIDDVISLRILIAVATLVAIVLAAKLIGYPSRIQLAIYYSLALVFFQLLSESFTDVFRSYERMEFVALPNLIGGTVLTVLSVWVLYSGYGLYELIGVYGAGHLLSSVMAVVLVARLLGPVRPRLNLKIHQECIGKGLPFLITSLMWHLMQRLDTIFLSKVATAEELGIYTAALVIITKLLIVPQSIGSAAYPAFSTLASENRVDELNNLVRYFFALTIVGAIPVTLVVSYFSKEFIELLFGERYSASSIFFKYAIWVCLIQLFGSISFSVLASRKQERLIIIVYFFATIVCIGLNIWLTVYYKSIGALISFVSTYVFMTMVMNLIVIKDILSTNNILFMLKTFVLNMLLFLFLKLFRESVWITKFDYSFILISSISLIFYILLLLVSKTIRISDAIRVMDIVRYR